MTAGSLIFPAPLAVQEAPPDPVQVQLMFVRFEEKLLATVAFTTFAGPVGFETRIV